MCKVTKSSPFHFKKLPNKLNFNYFKERLVHFNGTIYHCTIVPFGTFMCRCREKRIIIYEIFTNILSYIIYNINIESTVSGWKIDFRNGTMVQWYIGTIDFEN